MKRIVYILLFLILVSFSNVLSTKESKSILITSDSTLEIKGTSNISDFKCVYNITNFNEAIPIQYEKKSDLIRFEKSKMVLENSCFDCGGKAINKDFNSLLKSDEHPQIILTLKEIKKKDGNKNKVDALIEIEIAGLSHSYLMETVFVQNKDWLISGKLKLNINDFNLKAPKKLFGLIVVSETIEISFKLVVKEY